ncbi:MAG: hypothetical protein ACLT33_05080 [Lachnospira pectinoschiza]
MVIADSAHWTCHNVSVYYGAYAFVGMLLYAIDLYADFTGGIDITIGVAQMFGITLPRISRRPFFQKHVNTGEDGILRCVHGLGLSFLSIINV